MILLFIKSKCNITCTEITMLIFYQVRFASANALNTVIVLSND